MLSSVNASITSINDNNIFSVARFIDNGKIAAAMVNVYIFSLHCKCEEKTTRLQ